MFGFRVIGSPTSSAEFLLRCLSSWKAVWIEVEGLSSQLVALFQRYVFRIPGLQDSWAVVKPELPPPMTMRSLVDGQVRRFLEWLHQRDFGYGHPDEVLGFLGCQLGVVFVHPGVLIPDVCHFKEILIQPGVGQGLLEQWLVRFRCAGRHHDPIEVFLLE